MPAGEVDGLSALWGLAYSDHADQCRRGYLFLFLDFQLILHSNIWKRETNPYNLLDYPKLKCKQPYCSVHCIWDTYSAYPVRTRVLIRCVMHGPALVRD